MASELTQAAFNLRLGLFLFGLGLCLQSASPKPPRQVCEASRLVWSEP